MKKQLFTIARYASALISMALLITVIGFGCGVGFAPVGSYEGVTSIASVSTAGNNDDLVVVSGKRTVSTAYYEQVIDNMQSVTGVNNLSNTTLNTFRDKLGSFSDYGSATSINAPMMHAFTSVSSEVCSDLIAQELATPSFLQGYTATTQFSDMMATDLIRRFSRAFWQRNESVEEQTTLLTDVKAALALNNDNNNNFTFRNRNVNRGQFRATLFLCTSMLASTSAIEI